MFDHIGLRVQDLDVSARFYAAALAPLGCAPGARGADYAGFGPPEATGLWLHATGVPARTGVHVCFRAPTQEAVQGFHAAGLAAGGRDNGPPGPRPDYGPKYYAAFLLDPDGNNVEAVCLR